jgi:hypothetical protein
MAERKPVKGVQIRVTECKKVYTGNGANGEYSIYEISAINSKGVLIQEPLASFTPLPIGDGTYDMQPYYKGDVFKNWTVQAPKGTGTAALEQRVKFLEEQVEYLVNKVSSIEDALQRQGGHQVPPPSAPQPQTAAASSRFGGDDDIPF